jgi:quercetin 2,3-dioxygenase
LGELAKGRQDDSASLSRNTFCKNTNFKNNRRERFEAVINTRTPITYFHFTIQQGSKILQPISSSYNAFCYVIDGIGLFGEDRIEAERGQIIIFNKDGMEISVGSANNSKSQLELLLIAGIPLNETLARYGRFVMNTNEEIKQAIEDYPHGNLGMIEF